MTMRVELLHAYLLLSIRAHFLSEARETLGSCSCLCLLSGGWWVGGRGGKNAEEERVGQSPPFDSTAIDPPKTSCAPVVAPLAPQ